MIGLKPAAASNITDAGIIGLTGVFVHVPSGQNPWLQSCASHDQREMKVGVVHVGLYSDVHIMILPVCYTSASHLKRVCK